MIDIAAFGEPISSPILGYVIPLSAFTEPCSEDTSLIEPAPNFACPKLCVLPPYEPDPSEPWIALVQRGKCEFVSKVREAQRLGARAVVVGGDNPLKSGLPDTLINMYSPGKYPVSLFLVPHDLPSVTSFIAQRTHLTSRLPRHSSPTPTTLTYLPSSQHPTPHTRAYEQCLCSSLQTIRLGNGIRESFIASPPPRTRLPPFLSVGL